MILIDNIKFLKNHYLPIRELMKRYETQPIDASIDVLNSKVGQPTIEITKDGRKLYIHSKYDPVQEAEQLIEKYRDAIDEYEHVLFYGAGLGYHIDTFMKRYPNMSFSIYEPNSAIFHQYISNKNLTKLPLKNLKHLFVEEKRDDLNIFLEQFSQSVIDKMLLISLPSYERIDPEQFQTFLRDFTEQIKNRRSSVHANFAFQKRWVINSAMNFPEVLQTPNILTQIDKQLFEGKPAIIVAAGPSLTEELENLRYIKENGLAYIFAVGSANKALLAEGIYPDAVCTYDPQSINVDVYKEIIEGNIQDIPMIFGSSVGFETVKEYPGPKLHMITSQDVISTYFLDNDKDIVQDAPTISLVTLQLLAKLQCDPIIFVGQNLAYRDDKYYAAGISYKNRSTNVTENEKKQVVMVEGVEGNKVATTPSMKRMAKMFAIYTSVLSKQATILNTTKGGQKIDGTIFEPLEEVIKSRLLESGVVEKSWFAENSHKYEINNVLEKLKALEEEFQNVPRVFHKTNQIFEKMKKQIKLNDEMKLEKSFSEFDKTFKQLQNNNYYRLFVGPINRAQYDVVVKKVQQVRFNNDITHKGKVILDYYGKYINDSQQLLELISPYITNMYQAIQELTKNKIG